MYVHHTHKHYLQCQWHVFSYFILLKWNSQSNPFDRFRLKPNQLNRHRSKQVSEMVQNDGKVVSPSPDQPTPNRILELDWEFVWNDAKILRLDCRPIWNLQKLEAVNSCHLVSQRPMLHRCQSNERMSVVLPIAVPNPTDIAASQMVDMPYVLLHGTTNNANLAIVAQIRTFFYISYTMNWPANFLPSIDVA